MDSSYDKFLSSLTSSSLLDNEVLRHIHNVAEQERMQPLLDSAARSLRGLRIPRYLVEIERLADQHKELAESSERWARSLTIIQLELPKRGWYLSGKEPCRLTERLARLAEAGDWKATDSILVAQASKLQLKVNVFTQWLAEQGVAECCIKRVRLFLDTRQSGNHEVATLVGVPLIDELCRYLYDGRVFTTKRGKQPKPEMACRKSTPTRALGHYCRGFVESFGLIHKDVDTARLDDEDYFNRAAIVHGQMRRSYGPKDSSKVFMTLMFLVFARDETGNTRNVTVPSPGG